MPLQLLFLLKYGQQVEVGRKLCYDVGRSVWAGEKAETVHHPPHQPAALKDAEDASGWPFILRFGCWFNNFRYLFVNVCQRFLLELC